MAWHGEGVDVGASVVAVACVRAGVVAVVGAASVAAVEAVAGTGLVAGACAGVYVVIAV